MDNDVEIMSIEKSRDAANEYLFSYISEQIKKARLLDERYALLWESIDRLLRSGGKRFRSYISLTTFQAFSGKPTENIIAIISAQELLHLALLIHDDIIDRDYIRYGIDNISGQYEKIYADLMMKSDEKRHYSDSAALLAGDLLISSSYQLLLKNSPKKHQDELMTILEEAIFKAAGGELLDAESAMIKSTVNNALKVAKLKTAHYSFVTPLMIGAVLAGVDNGVKSALAKMGYDLGVAYQLIDDELGIFGNEDITGKSCLSDIAEGKKTFMIEQFYNLANAEQKKEFNLYFGHKNISEVQIETIRKLLVDSGARHANQNLANELYANTLGSVDNLSISDDHKQTFSQLIKMTLKRNK